jgi:predicted ArsR family transcriptional regulator
MIDRYPHTPGHRQTDTSADAADAMQPLAETVRASCLDVLKSRGPLTADETADALGLSILTVRPRMTELRQMGLARDSGDRRPNRSGKSAIVWELGEDLERAREQREAILHHLLRGESINPREALARYDCLRLAARIDELRKQGHAIQMTLDKRHGHAVYALQATLAPAQAKPPARQPTLFG